MEKIIFLYKKYRELIVYVICGGLTTVVSFAVQYGAGFILKGDAFVEARTVISWIAAVLFAFFVNKIFVFKDTDENKEGKRKMSAIGQFASFVVMRLLSLAMEVIVLSVGVRLLGFGELWVKLAAQVIVVISNYFFSKYIIFARK